MFIKSDDHTAYVQSLIQFLLKCINDNPVEIWDTEFWVALCKALPKSVLYNNLNKLSYSSHYINWFEHIATLSKTAFSD